MSSKLYGIVLYALASIFLAPSESRAQKTREELQIEVILRMIGHQVLLKSGDSTSRVLPIEKEEGRYRIDFDTEFMFNPDDLVATVNQVVQESKLNRAYIVEVEECSTSKVVYSYQMSNIEDTSNIACRSRTQPMACYSLLFTLLKLETDEEYLGSNDTEEKHLNYLLILAVFGLLIAVFLFLRAKKNKSKINPNLITLGKFSFDKHNAELIIAEQRIELTSKEADLLLLLHKMVNTTVERELILNQVWGDEGDYIGRTLDVFISKLRKKLDADSSIKIVNIRGVGYKLVV